MRLFYFFLDTLVFVVGISKNYSGSWEILPHPGKETLESESLGPHAAETPLTTISDVTSSSYCLVQKRGASARGTVPSHQAQRAFTVRGGVWALVQDIIATAPV